MSEHEVRQETAWQHYTVSLKISIAVNGQHLDGKTRLNGKSRQWVDALNRSLRDFHEQPRAGCGNSRAQTHKPLS